MRNCQALEVIVVRDASHLQRLPQEIGSLTSLQSLQISLHEFYLIMYIADNLKNI